jgi:hypothetical protein
MDQGQGERGPFLDSLCLLPPHLLEMSAFRREISQTKWCIPVLPALRKMRKKDLKFKASLGYVPRPCLTEKRERTALGWELQTAAILPATTLDSHPSAHWHRWTALGQRKLERGDLEAP